MIDIHCHILPDFDDGAENFEEAVAMAEMAVASGTTGIVVTPHFPGTSASLSRMPELLEQLAALREAVAERGLPLTLYPGCEILCLPETPRLAARGALPTIADSRYLLTEFYFNESAAYIDRMLGTLSQMGYVPVVAHPERYGAVQKDLRLLEHWFRRGYVIQVNKGSVLGAFGPQVQDTAARILGVGLAHVIASDAHSPYHRTTDMTMVRDWLLDNCDPEYAHILLEENPARLVTNRKMVPVE